VVLLVSDRRLGKRRSHLVVSADRGFRFLLDDLTCLLDNHRSGRLKIALDVREFGYEAEQIKSVHG
jgi:hypothetical protein